MIAYIIDIEPDLLETALGDLLDEGHSLYIEGPAACEFLLPYCQTLNITLLLPFLINPANTLWKGRTIRKGIDHHSIALWAARNADLLVISKNLYQEKHNQIIIREAMKYGKEIRIVVF